MSAPTSSIGPMFCLIDEPTPCRWSAHNYKHAAAKGVVREDTRHGPARYLVEYDAQVRELEMSTVGGPTWHRGTPPDGKTEYLRDAGAVIGWDRGQDATLSYVECSGGEIAGRSFHGRPMHAQNRTAASMRQGEDA